MAQRSKSYLIDIHHHALAPFYRALLDDLDIHYLAGGTPIPTWSPQVSLDLMDKNGIAAAMFLITGWGAYPTTITRRSNEYWARVIQDHPGRFGAYATLNFPDLEGALKELEYSIDTLKLDGVGILSNIQGHYLTDPEYGELLAELNRRKMVVNFHANVPPEGHPGLPPDRSPELGLDVLRIVAKLTRGGFFNRYPDIHFIIPFNGTAIPVLAGEFAGLAEQDKAKIPALKRQYFTIRGQPADPPALRALQEFFGPSKIMWATDFLIGDIKEKSAGVTESIKQLRQYDGFDEKTRALVEHGNAIALFPRLKKYFKE